MKLLVKDPQISVQRKFISGADCRKFIGMAQGQLEPAKIVGTDAETISDFRKSENAWFDHRANDTVGTLCDRVAAIVGMPINHAEKLQIVRYPVGGKFDAHYDTFDDHTPASKKILDEGGQRLYTALMYLNSMRSGGETFFPELKINIAPEEGTLLVFANCRKGSIIPHPHALHGSRMIKKGEKWIMTLWFRDRPQYTLQ
ncbi:prolyl hydroxylase family protein [Paenibacillus contaminans]|uniref:2OG-Fe(II) oxygenase n=1 Tax=Paenibacillus contaminans TaxID=450362 RepID=A0A329MK75_9BACL|nr:2OG-Fe(II) oxygenase [Paenibacillus contaminans]RAV19978.1 2OG-Fe(II) oxygenase [Paenibacillus contaminans]